MSNVDICELDKKLNQGRCLSAERALKRVEAYIIKTIDPTFPEKEFMDWVDSDSDKPFRWNKVCYYWNS